MRGIDALADLPAIGDFDGDGRLDLQQGRQGLRDELHAVTAERRLLLEAEVGERSYRGAVATQSARLSSLELLPPNQDDGGNSPNHCPICASELAEPDATVEQLGDALATLRLQLEGISAAQPARRSALAGLDERAAALREELRVVDAALRALVEGDRAVDSPERDERREFTRGRISAMLGVIRRVDESEIARLSQEASIVGGRVDALAAELDDDEVAMQLDSRLLEIGRDMTDLAQTLSLEHTGPMRLDLGKLTVITETDQGPAPLWRVGSAENWIGAHLVAHLGLHRYFARHGRPVPRFLMLDQPTQAWYPSDVEEWDGVPVGDSDREAVRAIFRLLLDAVADLAPHFQVIVCDHANLSEDWFQDSIVHNWRGGERLIPAEWYESCLLYTSPSPRD